MEIHSTYPHMWYWWGWPQPPALDKHMTQPWLTDTFHDPGHEIKLQMGMHESEWLTLFLRCALGETSWNRTNTETTQLRTGLKTMPSYYLLIWILLKTDSGVNLGSGSLFGDVLPGRRNEEPRRVRMKKRRAKISVFFHVSRSIYWGYPQS